MKRFVIGDIHGNLKGFEQCLKRSGFDNDKDQLIALGDYNDGWPQSREVYDKLLTIKNLIAIMGNHDFWFLDFIRFGIPARVWLDNGGKTTLASYGGTIPKEHEKFLLSLPFYYLSEDNKLFVHGGIDPNQHDIRKQDVDVLMWDRSFIRNAYRKHYQKPDFKYGPWDEIFVGHTTTCATFRTDQPLHVCNAWNLDTGGGWEGRVSMMNVDTKEVFQSDFSHTLYPEHRGRFDDMGDPAKYDWKNNKYYDERGSAV